jgi:hypothetical protein
VKPRKYINDRREVVTSVAQFDAAWMSEKAMFVRGLFNDRAVSGRVVANMSHAMVMYHLAGGSISIAARNPEYEAWLHRELGTLAIREGTT